MKAFDGRLRSRINITPAALDVNHCFTIANLHMFRLNVEMCTGFGGDCIAQFEDTLAENESITYRSDRRPICESILRQASHYGVGPSSVELLESLGTDGKHRIQYQSEYRKEVVAIWEHSLPYREWLPEPYKDWPPLFPEGAHHCATTMDAPGTPNGLPGFRGVQPALVADRVIRDMLANRNCFVNGEECQHYKGQYNDICLMLNIAPPLQLTAPLIRRRTKDGTIKVISASDPTDNPYYVQEAMNAGVTYNELWGFLARVVFRPSQIALYSGFTGRLDQPQVDAKLLPFPVIDDAAWIDVLETARARQAKAREAEAAEAKRLERNRKQRERRARKKAEK